MYVRILLILLSCVLLLKQNATAEPAVVRVQCARENAQLFVNGAPKGKCPTEFFKDLFLKPGKYTILAKQELKDGSAYSSEETLSVYADVVERLIFKVDTLTYGEEYYWQKCRNKEKSCTTYLENYPNGKYTPKVKEIIAKFPKPGSLYTEPSTGMEFVYIPGGCYQMGDTFGDCDSDEQPVHKVCVNGFYIGKYEVTIGQYRKYLIASGNEDGVGWKASNYCPLKKEDSYPLSNNKFGQTESQPMVEVSWDGAVGMSKWLSGRSSKAFRLPTEAEWEYAARSAGEKRKYSWGNDLGSNNGNCDGCGSRWDDDRTAPVGSFSPNQSGLYDMSGNVYEWCSDWYGKKYYGSSAMDNPSGPSSGTRRVIRGGSWYHYSGGVRLANRLRNGPVDAGGTLGFRLVLSPGQQ